GGQEDAVLPAVLGLASLRRTRWDGFSRRLSLPLLCSCWRPRRPRRGLALRPGSARAGSLAPTTSSTPSSSRCGNASATARLLCASSYGAVPEADRPPASAPSAPGIRSEGSLRECLFDRGLDAYERLRRVHIDERRLTLERHLDHRLAVAADEMSRAHVALDCHQVGEEPARP